ncbi:MAG TPA: hypothetical protein GXZ60_10440 [Intrasporangiaceae bacterium]|nr:hypothetical protein [Intrasporangiaceae bacterium]
MDLGWRLHRAGERVLLVPEAVVEIESGAPDAAAPTVGALTSASRRAVRSIALGAAPVGMWPARILVALLTGVVTAAALLLAKRPRAAGREIVDALALLRLDRAVAANRRFARESNVPRRALRQLFVAGDQARSEILDELMPVSSARGELSRQDLALRGSRPQAVAHPAFLAVLGALLLTIVSGRDIGGSVVRRLGWGITGGEVTGASTSAADLWRSAVDAWGGAGLGSSSGGSPALGLFAAATAVAEHLPFVESPAAPAAATVAGMLFLTLPAATLTMYAALALVTPRRLLRAFGGLAWAGTGLASQIIADGRLGGAVVLVVAPLAAVALIRALSPAGRSYHAAQAGLAVVLLGAFAPVVAVFAMVVVVLLGLVPRWSLRRALGVTAVPLLVLAPFVRQLVRDPVMALGGVGLFDWGGTPANPWRLVLFDPGGGAPPPNRASGSDAVDGMGGVVAAIADLVTPLLSWAAVPLILLALVGLLRSGRRLSSLVAVMVAAFALAGAVFLNRIVVDIVPVGSASAGSPIRPWSGALLTGYTLVIIGLAVRGLDVLSRIGLRRRWVRLATPVVGLTAVVGLAAASAWSGFGTALSTFVDVRPAVSVDHADGDLAGRTLVVERLTADEGADQAIGYRILGAEGALPVRTLPAAVEESPSLTALVSRMEAGSADSPGSDVPGGAAGVLARHAVGYVVVTAALPAHAVRAMDATDGLRRLPDRPGMLWWRVDGVSSDAPSPARVVLRTPDGDGVSVPSRNHAQADADLSTAGVLEVAQTPAWSRTARVSVDGILIPPQADNDVVHYTVPDAGRLSIDLMTPDRPLRLLAAIALLMIGFLALPFGPARHPSREQS